MEILRISSRTILGLALFWIGITHLGSSRIEFQAQVPVWLPLDPDFVVIASGILEIILGVLLLVAHRALPIVGIATACFLVLIFPGNIDQYVQGRDAFGLNSDEARLGRLFFQPLLIGLSLWSTSSFRFLRERFEGKPPSHESMPKLFKNS